MRIVLLGTAGPAGLPEPACRCARCAQVRASGAVRTRSSALVDDVLLLDEPEAPSAYARAGLAVDAGRAVARTDGSAPPDTGPHRVSVLAAAPAGRTALDVVGPSGDRLLWAPAGLAASATPSGAPYTVVLLGGPDGDVTAPSVGHTLARLRTAGMVTAATDVVTVGIGHRSPAAAATARPLAAWGMRVLPDGAWLPGEPAAPALPGRTLVLGGARSGKSAAAERLLAAAEKVTYVATAASRDDDAEWVARVATHRARRPATWSTVETADVAEVLRAASGPVLVDCLSLWLAGVLDDIGFWDEAPGADAALAARTDDLLDAWRAARVPVVAVSSEVGSGVVPATAAGRRYRDELGLLNARVAAESEDVLLVVAGRVLPLTGPAPAGPA